jgi:hypothetical protein
MRQWEDRSPAVADMLNPALLAAVIAAAASEYTRLSDEPMPYGYAFLVAPLVLHHDTRAALPTSANSHLARWLANHEVIAAGFGERARALTHPVREGIRLGLRTGTLRIENGALYGTLATRTRPARIGDIANVILKSGFVGRWLTKLDRPATAFALFGVTP